LKFKPLQGANQNSSDKSESNPDLSGLEREIVGLIFSLKISKAPHKLTFSEYDFESGEVNLFGVMERWKIGF